MEGRFENNPGSLPTPIPKWETLHLLQLEHCTRDGATFAQTRSYQPWKTPYENSLIASCAYAIF
jgi:hypothetical protein